MLFRLVIAFLPRSKCLLILWLQSLSTVILEPKKKSLSLFISPSICHEVMGPDAMNFVFWVLSFKPAFSLSSRGSSVPLIFCHKGGAICISKFIDISPGNADSSLCFIHPGILHDQNDKLIINNRTLEALYEFWRWSPLEIWLSPDLCIVFIGSLVYRKRWNVLSRSDSKVVKPG